MCKIGLSGAELLLIADHRKCTIGRTIEIGEQTFRMGLSESNSRYLYDDTKQTEQTRLAA